MEYTELVFSFPEGEAYQRDLFADALADLGADTFEETGAGFNAYLPSAAFNESAVRQLVAEYQKTGLKIDWSVNTIAAQNWNQVWESNFEPLLVGGGCYIRATFHEPKPDYPFEIVIDPKMAFGTGHHHTTALVIGYLLDEELTGKRVLDMGSGTGILAILAAKKNAAHVVAIDNDPVCFDSAVENCRLNGTPGVVCGCGSVEAIPREDYDVVIANINRNILLEQLPVYADRMAPGALLILSGFYEADLPVLRDAAAGLGLSYADNRSSSDWVAARFYRRA